MQNLNANDTLLIVAFFVCKNFKWLAFYLSRDILLVLSWWHSQGRTEPNVGPGPAQIWWISGFVNSKTDRENAAVLSELWCNLKKKKALTEILMVFPVEIWWSQKKKFLGLTCWFFSVISMGPLLSTLKPTAFLKPMGRSPKVHGPRGHCAPFRWPWA